MPSAESAFSGDVGALIATLRSWLHSEMSISQPRPEQDCVEITVRVQNDAPPNEEDGQVVFIGVGLCISDGQVERTHKPWWISGIQKTRPSDRQDLRQRYNRGVWVGGDEQFPATTSDEESFGDILFPGESVVYEMQIPTEYLPYIEIRAEGSVSRRHLFRSIQTMKGLEQWTRPLLIETFRALNVADIHRPVAHATHAISEFGPQTTLQEIEALRQAIVEARGQINAKMGLLNKVFHSAPSPEIRDHLKQVVGRCLTSTEKACADALEALASGNIERMRHATDGLKQCLSASEEATRKTLQLMSQLGLTPEETGFVHSSV